MGKFKEYSTFKKTIIILLILLILIPLITLGYILFRLNSTHVDDNYNSQYQKVEGITNILLLGTDGKMNNHTDQML